MSHTVETLLHKLLQNQLANNGLLLQVLYFYASQILVLLIHVFFALFF